jgi:hypothetical protein
MISNDELFALSRRIRGKSALLLDTDPDLALDLMKAALALDDLLASRNPINTGA